MKASSSTAILAFCAALATAAPLRPSELTFADDRWPPKGEDEFGQPQIIPSKNPIILDKRDPQFDLKSLIPDFSKANPNDDSPFNPFDDPGLPGKRKRDPQFDLKSLIPDFSKANPNDDSPFNPFDDSGLPGKRKRDPQFDLKSLIPDFSKANPNDDSPFNPFDDPGLPGKRDAEPLLNLPVQGNLPVVGDLGKLPVVNDLGRLPVVDKLPAVGDLLGGGKEVEDTPQQ